jgi:hypothetical protein
MRPLKPVVTVQGLVGVVQTMSTTMSHNQSHICHLLHHSLQRYSSRSFLEASAMLNNRRRTWKIFCIPLPKMFRGVIIKVVAMG